ncbi:PQ loop repeat-domain-containing protein [Syncephalis fuscata]|nr:PQ loop repeat-domain-containing protein [Syncephalis fuscata]
MQTHTREIVKEVLGSLSLLFWSFQLVPQIWKMYKERSSKGVSGLMMLIWIAGCAFYASYAVALDLAVTLIIQPEVFLFFAIICYAQCIYYEKKLSKLTAVAIMLLVASLCVGLQVGSIYGTIEADRQGLTGVVAFMGILPAVLIDIGFLPQYWEVWVTKSASGISYGFLVMDTLGSIFAILSLIFHEHFDSIAASTYISVLILDLGLLAIKIIFALRDRTRLRHNLTTCNTVYEKDCLWNRNDGIHNHSA